MHTYLDGIGLLAPGLESWGAGRTVLAGEVPYFPSETPLPVAAVLPANERRRAPNIVRVALATGMEALGASRRDPAVVPAVFASSGGDGNTIHEIMTALASPQRELSPTRFHNSVHNVSAGYWSIATGSRAATTSLCCHDGSFAAGLLETAAQAAACEVSILVSSDTSYPYPLGAVRPVGVPFFGVALVLSSTPSSSTIARFTVGTSSEKASCFPDDPALESLCHASPAARCLPLLVALAKGTAAVVTLEYLPDLMLQVEITPHMDERSRKT